MKNLEKYYNELVLDIINNKEKFNEQKVAFFTPVIGTKYDRQFLIFGRATNGWYASDFGGLDTIINFNENIDSDLLEKIKNNISTLNTDWIEQKWSSKEKTSTKKSPFFRMVKSISELSEGGDFYTIAWSNLYKVSKLDEGNPSEKLCQVQEKLSKEIFLNEIEILKPKYVILLTGLNWANPFINDLEIISQDESEFIKYIAKYKNSYIIVSEHPQGKPEEQHLEDIKAVIKKYN